MIRQTLFDGAKLGFHQVNDLASFTEIMAAGM
jgi:hypothetical protein